MMVSINARPRRSTGLRLMLGIALLGAPLALAGCNTSQVFSHGYQVNEDTLTLVPEGSSREQVILALGTPSTTLKQNDIETYYYISQTKRKRAAFMQGKVVGQRVLAVYFDQKDEVSQIADYSLKDGKVFDSISRVTPTGGKDLSFLSQILGAAGAVANPLGG